MSELEGSPVTTRPSQKPELDARGNEIRRGSRILAAIELPNDLNGDTPYELPDASRENEIHQ
jgi:hypothetical protein